MVDKGRENDINQSTCNHVLLLKNIKSAKENG